MKRAIDLLLALPLFVLSLPLMVLTGLAVRLTSPGPALLAQERVGREKGPFLCLKLRTMVTGTPVVATHDAPGNAVTPLGAVLRRWHVDELPQLWNVIAGEMSLVGPRPCLPTQTELVALRERAGVYALRPGITGLAQVRGIDMSNPVACAAADAEYLATQSLAGDLAILRRTVLRF